MPRRTSWTTWGWTRFSWINLILLVEEEFAVEIDFESFQIVHLSSLDRFTNYVAGPPRT